MGADIFVVIAMNIIIAVIGTLAYAVRMVGIRTGKIAVSFALFNALSLISRTANLFQLPLLTKYVEENTGDNGLLALFNIILVSIFAASVIGTLLIPTFQRLFTKAVLSFSTNKSIFRLILHSFSKAGIKGISQNIKLPTKAHISKIDYKKLPYRILIFNVITVALLTVGVFAPVYVGNIMPELRATCLTLSSVVTGIASILLALFVDPYLSILTDEVIEGKYSEGDFRGCVIGMIGSRLIGTALSIFILVPAAYAIVFIAQVL